MNLDDSTRSAIGHHVERANSSAKDSDKKIMSIVVTIALTLVSVNGLCYLVTERVFGELSESSVSTASGSNADGAKAEYAFGMTGTVPTTDLDDGQFQVYVGFVMYITMVLTGLGLEYLMWTRFLKNHWDQKKEDLWRVVQFIFPILGATSLGLALTGNWLALPFLVVTMWKFGFPETILYFYSALYGGQERGIAHRLIDFVNGVGTAVHHSSSALCLGMLVVHAVPPSRDIVASITPLLMQHWFVLLQYDHNRLYIILEILIEVWFEWNIFSSVESLYKLHWLYGMILLAMLFAHWCYFGAGIIGLVFSEEGSTPTSHKLAKHIARQSKPRSGFVRRMSTKKLVTKATKKRLEEGTGDAPHSDSHSDWDNNIGFDEFLQHLKSPNVKEMHAGAEENL